MPAPETLHIRCTVDLTARIDALAAALAASIPGMEAKRSNALRAALLAGLPVLEKQYGITAPKAEAAAAPTTKRTAKPGRKRARVRG